MLQQRGMEIKNRTKIVGVITSNKTIIEYAIIFTKMNQWDNDKIADIN